MNTHVVLCFEKIDAMFIMELHPHIFFVAFDSHMFLTSCGQPEKTTIVVVLFKRNIYNTTKRCTSNTQSMKPFNL